MLKRSKIKYSSQHKQLSIDVFHSSLSELPKENRWVKLGDSLPWAEIENIYNRRLNNTHGSAGNKPARMIIGAVLIKHKMNLSDEETIQAIRENSYMQYMLGLKEFSNKPVFDSSLFVTIRKRIGKDDFNDMSESLLKLQIKMAEDEKATSDKEDDEDRSSSSRDASINDTFSSIRFEPGADSPHKGILKVDATCNSTNFMSDPSGNRRFHVFEVTSVDMNYRVNYEQLFAQVIHLYDTGFKYYFTPQEQEELSAYNYQFEENDAEYDFLVEYVRKYPSKCQQKKNYMVSDILKRLKFFNPEYVIDKAAQIRMGKALARRNYQYKKDRNKKLYECYLLTAEQAEYCVQYKSTTTYLDVLFDKYVAKEILLAGDNAKIADICKAREFLDQVDGKFKEAQKLYNEYIRNERGINLTNDNLLPF